AESLPRAMVLCLERAILEAASCADRYAWGHFRMLLGSSSRFDDGQHCPHHLGEKGPSAYT
ncbi:MAG: hypothetical protein CMP30_02550, partial [Roseibacillus sp.]|nr:hypothetical protein [Roseibacillus sp.]